MVLQALGQPLLAQANLFTDSRLAPRRGLADGSGRLCWTLNNRQAAKRFTLGSTDTEGRSAHDMLVDSPLPVRPGGAGVRRQHWLVVRSYSASAAPSSAFDTAYTIQSST
jgi:hypothetical protein